MRTFRTPAVRRLSVHALELVPARHRASGENHPVVIGFGGINGGGRMGGPNRPSFNLMVHDGKPAPKKVILEHLRLTGQLTPDISALSEADLNSRFRDAITANTFVRKAPFSNQRRSLFHEMGVTEMVLSRAVLDPKGDGKLEMPDGWKLVQEIDGEQVRVSINAAEAGEFDFSSASSVPDGAKLRPDSAPANAKSIPRNLWLSLFGLGDALRTSGITSEEIAAKFGTDQVGLYVGSALGQLCERGVYGYMAAHLRGERPDSKLMPFSLINMPLAFAQAYTVGMPSHGSCDVAACNTFLANLYTAMMDIRSGKRRLAIVGASDAPLLPWVLEPFNSMTALVRDKSIPRDAAGNLLYAQAPRPFRADRAGFVPGEGSAYVVLADRRTVLEQGFEMLGLVGGVARRLDGWKKSISNTGLGDYLALYEVMQNAVATCGIDLLRTGSMIACHGSSTPENERSEGSLYHRHAEAFGIERWPVTATKSFVGHTMGPAGGDSFLTLLMSLVTGVIPPIRNLGLTGADPKLSDVLPHLELLHESQTRAEQLQMGFSVSKGFGGDNGAALVYGPEIAERYVLGGREQAGYLAAREARRRRMEEAQATWMNGADMVDYRFGNPLLPEAITELSLHGLNVRGYLPLEPASFDP